MKTFEFALQLLPLLNLFLIPIGRTIWRTSKRLDVIEFNQRRLCDKLKLEYIEVK